MSSSRLVPYVEIRVNPRSPSSKRRSDSISVSPTQLRSDHVSPRKKRKTILTDAFGSDDDGLTENFRQVNLQSQSLSPTASEFSFSRQLSPTASDFRLNTSPDANLKPPEANHLRDGQAEENEILHFPTPDEIEETEDLVIPGEISFDEVENSIPVRLLTDFVIYDDSSKELVTFAELLGIDYSHQEYRAAGMVKPWIDFEEDGEEADEDSEDSCSDLGLESYVSLSKVLELSIHTLSEDQESLDGKIYIRTKFAWYILEFPAKRYQPYFAAFWLPHRLLHLLVSAAMTQPRLTYNQFVGQIQELDKADISVTSAEQILSRELDAADLKLESVAVYIISMLPDLCTQNDLKISRVPAIRDIFVRFNYDFDEDLAKQPIASKKNRPRSGINKEKEVLKRNLKVPTFILPIVSQIAKGLFEDPLDFAESSSNSEEYGKVKNATYQGHKSNPHCIELQKEIGKNIYSSAIIDGQSYTIGDFVMVEPDSDSRPKLESDGWAVNKYGNRWWFCQIQYFYKDPRDNIKLMFHGLWLSHGTKTLLQETSHSKALYMLEACDNNPVNSIFQKCNVQCIRPGEEEVADDTPEDCYDFHCGLLYNEQQASFQDIPKNALNPSLHEKSCYSCDVLEPQCSFDNQTITLHGIQYHTNEFVYIHPSNGKVTTILEIGQITQISSKDLQVHVRYLGRYDDYVVNMKLSCFDERKLFLGNETGIISMDKLDGICHVHYLTKPEEIDDWIQHDDHYYLNQVGSISKLVLLKQEDFTFCQFCRKKDDVEKITVQHFLRTNSKLVGMELFSGAGGLGLGMDMSEFVETKYAIEYSPSAAQTYRTNHPQTTVYCENSNTLLKHAIMSLEGKTRLPVLETQEDGTKCPPLPNKNEGVDFIFGGPPCQSFSRANHSKKRNDIRSSQACNMLSYVEYYDPKYFLLENVAGFLDHKFYRDIETTSGVVEHKIQSGMVKFVLRALIALGYQVRFGLLQAGQYGIPQTRRRVIFWGAKRGIPLPNFPIPLFAFPKGADKISLPTGTTVLPPTRSKGEYHNFAPFKARTVNDAIGDLPPFDWANPHQIIKATKETKREEKERLEALGIPRFNAVGRNGEFTLKHFPGFPRGAHYPTEPRNRYQKWLRSGMDGKTVTGQFTTMMPSRTIEATTNVPLRALADHRNIPKSLLLNSVVDAQKNRTFYGRMDGNGYFRCAVTTLSPNLKNQWPLHPSQKRIITVREAARSQGFPDSYIFESINSNPIWVVQDQLRQIGNAVAVPFALELGKELGKAMIQEWKERQKEGSPAL